VIDYQEHQVQKKLRQQLVVQDVAEAGVNEHTLRVLRPRRTAKCTQQASASNISYSSNLFLSWQAGTKSP